jgi:hypothetical protein
MMIKFLRPSRFKGYPGVLYEDQVLRPSSFKSYPGVLHEDKVFTTFPF